MFQFVNLKKPTSVQAFGSLREWLSDRLGPSGSRTAGDTSRITRKSDCLRLAIACVIVFMIASGVGVLHRQDNYLSDGLGSLTHRYLNHAQQMIDGDGILFPRDFNEPANVQLLVHPPGYSMFVAAVFRLFGNS